jgi:hypothetical protein
LSSSSSSNTDSNGKNNPIESGGGSKNNNNNSNDSDRHTNNNISPPDRWILVLGIAILIFGVILLTLRSVLFSLILITIGISLFTYWLYVSTRSREQSRNRIAYISSSSANDVENTATTRGKQETVCNCSICRHKESRLCLEMRCPCCILMRNKQIIGHFDNPLQ